MQGYLLIDKPKNWTSFDVVKRIRSLIAINAQVPARKIKVGHSGTLDPFATGLLIILVGKSYTTQAERLLKQDKSYEVIMELDSSSTTGDSEGKIVKEKSSLKLPPSRDDLLSALTSFHGEIMQTPPIYSAIKINGIRAYKLARENKPVKLEPRKVTIGKVNLVKYDYPLAEFKVDVSSGTYIRSLVEDIGKVMDRCAYTLELRRTRIGLYSIEQAVSLDMLNEQNIYQHLINGVI
jgi:tRNA pseudouridine55 synthase